MEAFYIISLVFFVIFAVLFGGGLAVLLLIKLAHRMGIKLLISVIVFCIIYAG